jgi:hypothetical protein
VCSLLSTKEASNVLGGRAMMLDQATERDCGYDGPGHTQLELQSTAAGFVNQLLPPDVGDHHQGTSVEVNGVTGQYFAPGSVTVAGRPFNPFSGILVFTEKGYSYSIVLFSESSTKSRMLMAMSYALSHLG